MIFHVPSGLVSKALVLSSSHGFMDAAATSLVPYLFLLVPLPAAVVASTFVGASVVHFARDVGCVGSGVMHALIVALTLTGYEHVAWGLVCLYTYVVHLPRHVAACTPRQRMMWMYAALIFLPIAIGWQGCFVVGPLAQKIVVAHVVVDHSGTKTGR